MVTGAEAGVLLLAAAVTFLPGLALLFVLGVRRPLCCLALAPAASIGVLGVLAAAGGPAGVPFGVAPVGGVVFALLAVGVAVRLGTSRGGQRRRWRPPSLAVLGGAGLGLTGAALGVASWLDGLGRLSTVAQEHDMIVHQLLVSYLDRTGRAAPWQVMPADLLTGSPVFFYPAGAHRPAALLADLGIDPVTALNAMSVLLLAVCWATSLAALTFVAALAAGVGRDSASLAAGVAAVIGATLYRPVFQLVHDGGLYPNAVAFTLAPGVLAAVVAMPPKGWRVPVALGVSAAGIVSVHPSAVVTVGLSAAAWFAGEALTRGGLHRLRRIALPLAGAGAVAAALLAPVLVQVAPAAGGASSFGADIGPVPFGDALGSSLGTAYGGFLDPGRTTGQAVFTVLYLGGVVGLLWRRRGLGLLAAWLTWVLVTFAFLLSPARGLEAPITGYFYDALLRVWSHVSLFVPSLAALGVVLAVTAVAVRIRRLLPLPFRAGRLVAVGTVTATVLLLLGPIPDYRAVATEAVASRYAEPDFTRVSADDLAAIEWLDGRVEPGQRVLNSANDGSTFLYVEAGIPVVNVTSLGLQSVPHTYRLLGFFNTYPENEDVRRLLTELNIAWVYVDSEAPPIGAGRAPSGWVDGSVVYTTAPGLSRLDELPLPGLDLRFQAGSVSVYRLDLDVVRALG